MEENYTVGSGFTLNAMVGPQFCSVGGRPYSAKSVKTVEGIHHPGLEILYSTKSAKSRVELGEKGLYNIT